MNPRGLTNAPTVPVPVRGEPQDTNLGYGSITGIYLAHIIQHRFSYVKTFKRFFYKNARLMPAPPCFFRLFSRTLYRWVIHPPIPSPILCLCPGLVARQCPRRFPLTFLLPVGLCAPRCPLRAPYVPLSRRILTRASRQSAPPSPLYNNEGNAACLRRAGSNAPQKKFVFPP